MNLWAAAFWGAFFGTAALTMAAALIAYARSMRKVALSAALSSLLSAGFVIAYLGWLPISNPEVELRLLAHVSVLCATVLGFMLLALLGALRNPDMRRRVRTQMVAMALVVLLAGWLASPHQSLVISSVMALGVGALALAVCVRSAVRGDRLAWMSVAGVAAMVLALAGLSWIALNDFRAPWTVHAASAVAGMAYLAIMGAALWGRYSYLIELRQVLAHGANYDPVTRMSSRDDTSQMLGKAFSREEGEARPVGVIVISIGNFYALEKLHGRAAMNHALFLCASRLRRCVPAAVEMGRLADDGFLLLMRNGDQTPQLVYLARQVAERLMHPVALSTSHEYSQLEAAATTWVADVGVGVLLARPPVRPAAAVQMARAMSRTAWTYPSRVAWYDQKQEQIAELPAAMAV